MSLPHWNFSHIFVILYKTSDENPSKAQETADMVYKNPPQITGMHGCDDHNIKVIRGQSVMLYCQGC